MEITARVLLAALLGLCWSSSRVKGVTFSLRGDSIPNDGSGLILITGINPNGDTNEDALICLSEIPISGGGNWYLHPTQMSTSSEDRIATPPIDRGWNRNRASDSEGRRLVRLRRSSDTAVEGVFTCDIPGDNNTPRVLGVYYPMSVSVSIEVVSEREGTFRVTCTATGGTLDLSTSSLTGPGLGGGNLELQAEGSIGRTGQNTYSVTSGTLSEQSNGDTYTCTATNDVSSPDSSTVLAVAGDPSSASVEQISPTTIRVMWSPPSEGATVSSYRVHYRTNSSVADQLASFNSTDITHLTVSATYTISVEAISQHLSGESEEMTITLLPGQPTVSVDSTTATSVSLSWTSTGSAMDAYVVMWTSGECPDDIDEGSTIINETIMPETSYIIEGLREGTNYTITVTASNAVGNANSIDSRTQEIAPSAAPTSVSVSAVTSSSITVQWGAVDCIHRNGHITGYSLQYGVVENGSTQTMNVSGGSITETTLSNLMSSTTYYIQVAAENSAGSGVYSDILHTLTEVKSPNASVTSTTASSISLSWTSAGSMVESYEVMWTSGECSDSDKGSMASTNGSGSDDSLETSVTITGNSTSYTIEGLRADTSYNVTVTAFNAVSNASGSTDTQTNETVPSAAPTLVRVLSVTSSNITVQWRAVDCAHRNGDITGYSVQYGVVGSGSLKTMDIAGNTVTEATIMNLTSSTPYSIQVAAVNSAGTGVYNNAWILATSDSVYLSLNDDIIPNHGYVVISDIGFDDDTALICNTNRPAAMSTNSGGDWFTPDGTRVNDTDVPGFRRNRAPMVVRLYRNGDTDPLSEGMYQCLVEDDRLIVRTVYVGLYNSGGGDIVLIGNITFTADSDLTGARLQFTLTCISTGGPATTVTWTRDSENVTEGTVTVLEDQVNAQYTHNLTVAGRLGGLYKCTVANDKPSENSLQLNIQVPSPPSGVNVAQNGVNSILVSWESPPGETAVTGYIIYYQQDRGQRLSQSAAPTATSAMIMGLIAGTYSITVVATSNTLPSTETITQTITIEPITISLTSSTIMAGNSVTLTCSVTLPTGMTPSFQWEVPGEVTPTPANNGELISSIITISEIKTSQAGQYTCTATLGGSVSTSVNITVQIPAPTPSITVSNMDTVYAGTRLSLTCDYTLSPSVDTTPQTAVTWVVDDVAVDISPGRISINGATLSFSPIATSDTGSYTCTLTVTASQTHVTVQDPVQSAAEEIHVEALPDPEVMISQENSTLSTGDSYTVECVVTDIPYLFVPPTVELIGPADSVLVTDMGFTLAHTVDPVMTSHAGQYTCRASIMIASVSVDISDQSSSTLTVQIPQPGVDVTLSHTAPLYAGTSLTLICTVTLDPNVNNGEMVKTEWSGLQHIPEERYSITGASGSGNNYYIGNLTISPLADQDNGTYTCMVTVTGGSHVQQATASDAVSSIIVNALPAPVVSISPASGSPTAGQTFSLTCSVQVVPHLVVEPSIEWTRQDGTVVNASSGSSLQLNFNPVMTSDSSHYTCRASVNIAGVVSVSSQDSRDLLLDNPSGAPEMFEADAGPRHVNFSWSPPPVTQRNGLITSYTFSCSPSPSSLPYSTSQLGPLTVAGLTPGTSYSCSVVASNDLGSGPPAQITFTTLQDYSLFQIRLVGLLTICPDFVNTQRDVKLKEVTEAALEQLAVTCTDCASTSDVIKRQSFACYVDSPTSVTYRARLLGTSETDSGSLISLIEKWVSGGLSIVVNGVLMAVDSECSVTVLSLSEGECSSTPPLPTTNSNVTTTDNTSTADTAASTADAGSIIGGVVAIVFIIAVTFAIVAIVITLIVKNHCGKLSINKRRRSTHMVDLLTYAHNRRSIAANSIYEVMDLGRPLTSCDNELVSTNLGADLPPCTLEVDPPCTPTTKPPCTPTAKPPSTPAAKPPSTPAAKPPSTPAAKPPSTPAANTPAANPPSTPAANPPSTPTANPPSTPAAKPPSTPAANPPSIPAADHPCTPEDDHPCTPADDHPCTPADDHPCTPAADPPCTPAADPPCTPAADPPCTKTVEDIYDEIPHHTPSHQFTPTVTVTPPTDEIRGVAKKGEEDNVYVTMMLNQ